MDPEERRKKHELNYGVYNFRDVKSYFTKEGWHATAGPPLSYDHYYVKPGKNPRNPEDVEGEDYFLGEAALVAYARKMKIFGPEAEPVVPVAYGSRRGKRRARSTSQTTVDLNSDSGKKSISSQQVKQDRKYKRHKRRSSDIRIGNSAMNPIPLSSDSSDSEEAAADTTSSVDEEEEEWTEGDTKGDFDEDEGEDGDDENDEEGSYSSSSASSDEVETEDLEDDDLEIAAGGKNLADPPQREAHSHVKAQHTKERQNGILIAETKINVKKEKKSPRSVDAAEDRGPRPLLKTAQGKHKKKTKTRKENASSNHSNPSSRKASGLLNNSISQKNEKRGCGVMHTSNMHFRKRSAKKVKSSSRSLLERSKTERPKDVDHGEWEDDDDNSFNLGVEQADSHNRASVSARRVEISPPLLNDEDVTVSQTSMELTQVVLPPDHENKYHIRVTVSSAKPPVTTIWMENLTSREQRSYSFNDIQELPGAKTDLRVPTVTVLTALFRSLSSQPDAVVIVGPEPRATAESKTAFEKGEVELRTSTTEKTTDDSSAGDSDLTLVVVYPALDLFRVEHNFPMELLSFDQQLQHLAHELERTREQLALVQTDRDRLCEQLRQQEEENEVALSLQVEAQVKARLERSPTQLPSDEIERHLADLVQERTRSIQQAQERERRDRDRARRWIYARSDWMTAFHPCRALIAAAGGGANTSLLRPTAPAADEGTVQAYQVEWREIVEIAEPFFQPIATGSGPQLTAFVTVVKAGLYQVNVNVSHDSLVHMRLVISHDRVADYGASGATAAREIAPTKVLLYDNKRRVSRVDQTLYLRAFDQISVELRLQASAGPNSRPEDWVRTPMPTHNRLMVQVLDEHQHSTAE
ncbi:hypothetical protein PHYBOEH_007021 [Phytophthora boehmeriae]|uniref:Uncharacterized protein n=1 Tax=Phytophthora boehmeriae TaxID=109152 RepID=A0A8T1X2I6_9STRA|nr:hypothetical protein PHYBOEH_007021 [Phytophthora boehmeriae]